MGMFMKVILSKEKKKEMENGFSKMVLFIRGPLKRTCSMERGHCRIRLWDILVNGRIIKNMDKELIFLKMGPFTKENTNLIWRMELGSMKIKKG